MILRSLIALAVCGLVACGSSGPAYVAGNYSINVTNEENGCGFQNWTVGNTAMGIPMMVTQQMGSADASATITGVSGAYLNAVFGTNMFNGTVDGDAMTLTLHSTHAANMGQCSYFVTATAHAVLNGDALMGTITYTTQTNASPDCGTIEGCTSHQNFNGTRPPM